MSVFDVGEELDDFICEFAFIGDDQRRQFSRHKSPCPVWRRYADAAGRKGFDDLERASTNALVRIDRDRAVSKVEGHVFNEIDNFNAGLPKTCVPCCDHTRVSSS